VQREPAASGSFRGEEAAGAPCLRWNERAGETEDARAAVEVVGLSRCALEALGRLPPTDERFRSFLVVKVVPEAASSSAPLWGVYRVEGNRIRFVPRFPLEPGTRYRAKLDLNRLQALVRALDPAAPTTLGQRPATAELVADFALGRPRARRTAQVIAVYPSGGTLPENLLRFYIHFSAPMSRGEAYSRIHLLDARGNVVDSAFLELAEELWSPDGMRFTLLFQPGRIKRGLRPRAEAGPILQVGHSYCLVIDRDWRDETGGTLQAAFRKSFQVGPADATSPDPRTWSIRPPRANSRDPLTVSFREPLDRALAERLVAVRDAAGRLVAGLLSLAAEETLWSLTPEHLWQPGDYRLEVGSELEDLAGNSVERPFEVDMVRPITARVTSRTVTLPFRILAADH
jgi:hypothetical protein